MAMLLRARGPQPRAATSAFERCPAPRRPCRGPPATTTTPPQGRGGCRTPRLRCRHQFQPPTCHPPRRSFGTTPDPSPHRHRLRRCPLWFKGARRRTRSKEGLMNTLRAVAAPSSTRIADPRELSCPPRSRPRRLLGRVECLGTLELGRRRCTGTRVASEAFGHRLSSSRQALSRLMEILHRQEPTQASRTIAKSSPHVA
mmetsp:Transcript_96372/g.201345  ORF Transcript_96372/g.201345 Transcript_96372/m.201345 type:complete len:200 (+) Transcript_96372:169-768(+)